MADHGGFSRAAKAVFISQPALSLAVRELEDELGTELFYRVGRQVRLTPAGQALLGPARQALRDVDTARAAVASVTGLLTGSLTLGSLPTLAADPLASLVGRFRTAHPGVRVNLTAPEDTADLAGLLQTGECELGLAEGATLPAGLTTRELTRQRLLVILPPGATRRAELAVAELGSTPFIAAPHGTSTGGCSTKHSPAPACPRASRSSPPSARPSCRSCWPGQAPRCFPSRSPRSLPGSAPW